MAYSVEKLFWQRFNLVFWDHQTPNRVESIDCRASYEASVLAVVIL